MSHCGISSTLEALELGIPILGVPHIIDQQLWAVRLAGRGAGIVVHPPEAVTADVVVDGVRRLLTERSFSASAQWFADVIARGPRGDGGARVVEDVVYVGSAHTSEFVLSPPATMLLAADMVPLVVYSVLFAVITLAWRRGCGCCRRCAQQASHKDHDD